MNKFMKLAISEAKKGISNGHGGPFGAVIVKDNKVIAKAHNEVIKRNDATSHGEVNAIRKASKKLKTFDLSGCEIYTTGEPCPMCLGAILWARIDKIYYGCNVDDTEIIGFKDLEFYHKIEHKEDMMNELNRKECLKLYQDYQNIKDKKEY